MTADNSPHFTRLTIAGFKSFADEVTVEILPGLTGIIGPNGCGKSNIVDALRWVMGESSARALRGGDSDDLIFAGTNARSARNLAQVSVQIDDAKGLAQPPFQDSEELVISRQAERGSNSTYRLNNSVVRARDIQMLFADMDSGARSSAIISQNRVSQIIEVKPEERRVLLEEAAGIKGLYVRRKDAESKLRQAQTNLEQAQRHLDSLLERIKMLSEQSEQARHYRTLSDTIRKTEKELLYLRHTLAHGKVETSQMELFQAQEKLEKTASLLNEKKAAFESLKRDEDTRKQQLESLRPRLEEQKLQMEIAQNNLSHIQKAWNERDEQFNDLKKTIDDNNHQLALLNEQENDYSKDMILLREDYDPSIDLSIEKQKIESQEKALEVTQSEYDRAKEAFHQANLRLETARNECETLQQRLKESQDLLEQIQSDLQKHEKICENSSLIKSAEDHLKQVSQTVIKAEQDKTAHNDLCQEQKIAVEKAKAALESDLQRHKQLSTQNNLISERLKTLEVRRHQTLQEQKTLESSIIHPQELDAKKQALSKARSLLEEADSQEKTARDAKDKQEEIWLKIRTLQKEKIQKKNLIELELKRLENLLQTTENHISLANKALLDAQSEAESFAEIESIRKNLADKETLYRSASQDIKSWQETLKSSLAKLTETRKQLHQQELELLQIKGEAEGLERSLEILSSEEAPSLFNSLEVNDDYAHALAVSLNEGLNAVLLGDNENEKNQSFKRGWRELPHQETLPAAFEGLQTLADYVKAPPALARALHAVYILEDTSRAPALQAKLSSGTCLISRDGSLWRWDGYVQSSSVQPSEAGKLKNLQRLRDLRSQEETLEETTKTVRILLDNEQAHSRALQTKLEKRRDDAVILEKELSDLRFQLKELEHNQDISAKKIHYAQTQLEKNIASKADVKNHIANLNNTLSELNNAPEEDRAEEQKTIKMREAVTQAHNKRAEAYSHFSMIDREYTQLQLHSENTVSRLKDIGSALKLIESDFQTLTNEKKSFDKELSELNLSETQKNLSEQQTELNNRLATSAKITARYQDLRSELEQAQKQLNILSQERSAALARRDTLRQQAKTQHDLCLSLDNALKTALSNKQALSPLKKEAEILETFRIKFEKDRNAFLENRTLYESLEQKIRHTVEQIQALSLKLQTLESDKTRLSKDVNALEQKKQLLLLSRQSQENPTQLAQQLDELREAYESLKTHYDDCEQKLSAVSAQIGNNRKDFFSLQDQHTKLREKSIGLTERVAQARSQLEQLETQEPLPTLHENEAILDENSQEKISRKNESSLRRDISRLMQERDDIGTVNLKAEAEYDEASKEAEALTKELSEITQAIDKQQKIVSSINREGRTRLNAVFADVDHHFQTLFARVFGGGKAHLAMIGSDDPLEAGLEIYAQPPGKKLSTLSLLSGGEQALTALSLIFAAFFCNPAPICVLDEIDAPLDEANVEQFCQLIIDINKETDTRFLVVTHHQVTMAHMNQLYGVTMQERGVSKVLSVNLSDSSKFIGS